MPSTLIKVGAGVAVLGGVATGSYFIRGHYTKERINARITKQGYTLLNSSDTEEEWAKRWKEYVEDKDANKWKLKDFEQTKGDKTKVPASFKNKCLNDVYSGIEDNWELASQLEKFCTKSFSIANLIQQDKTVKLLDKTADNDDSWKAAYKKYFDGNNAKSNPFNLNDWLSVRGKKDLPTDYKDKCAGATKKEVRTTREGDYINVKSYCTELVKISK